MTNFYFPSPFSSQFGFGCQSSNHIPAIFPEEWAVLSSRAVEKRKREFSMGRAAAHSALVNLGVPAQPILRGANNEPCWPSGIVGSISHSGEMAVAVVAFQKDCDGVGIDIEWINPQVSWELVDRISLPAEKKWLEEFPENRYERFFSLFSAKESIFKAFFPQYSIFLDFKDAEIRWDTKQSCFIGKLCKKISSHYDIGYSFIIGHQMQENYVMTYLALPPKAVH